ncbi:hypothetical protein Tco_0613581 [Tanacetum coccineum]
MSFRTNNPDHSSEEDETENHQITFSELRHGFNVSFMIKQDLLNKISKQKLLLNKEQAFKIPRTCGLLKPLRQKNENFYFVNSKEMHVDISETTGAVYLPLITKDEINKSLSKINSDIKNKISCVHLGAVKFLIKSEFRSGIDTPIKMVLLDNKIESKKDCILGIARGNLAYSRFMFTVYPQYGISLDSKDLDQVLAFVYEFERPDLMKPDNKVFSITYLVAYALTSSHHSIDYKKKEYIKMDDLFTEIVSVEGSKFATIKPIDETWAINIAKDKRLIGQKPSTQVRRNILHIGEVPHMGEASSSNIGKSMRKMPQNIDSLKEDLHKILHG